MYQDIYNCICQSTKKIKFIIHYVKPTAQLLFKIRLYYNMLFTICLIYFAPITCHIFLCNRKFLNLSSTGQAAKCTEEWHC